MMNIAKAAAVLLLSSPLLAQSVPSQPVAPKSCGEPGAELETTFELSVPKGAQPIKLAYAGCDSAERNDLLNGYTERDYRGHGDYSVAFVTGHNDGAPSGDRDESSSEILVYKGKDIVARGYAANVKLTSGLRVESEGYGVRADKPIKIAACEAALPKPVYGDNTLWLLTKTKAYYYREDCDICAELDSCDLQSHAVKEEIVAHMVSCSDLDKFRRGADVLYDDCTR